MGRLVERGLGEFVAAPADLALGTFLSVINAAIETLEQNGLEILQETKAKGEGVRLLKPQGKAAE